MGRGRKRILICGGTETGKSTLILEIIEKRRKTENNVIIHDPNRQTKYLQFAEINFDQFRNMKKGCYRINNGEFKTFFNITYNHFKNGLVVSEDASTYLTPYPDKEIYPNLIALRHKDHNVDLIFVAHALRRVPPYLIEQLNEIVLFKTGDSWEKIKDRFPDNKVEEIKKAFDEVNGDPNPHAKRKITILKTGTT